MARPTAPAPASHSATDSAARDGDSPRVVESAALLAGRSQLAILHNKTIYFLRETRLRKLILTK